MQLGRVALGLVVAGGAVTAACSSSGGSRALTASSSCRSYLAATPAARHATYLEVSQEVRSSRTDAAAEASLATLCGFNTGQALGAAIQSIAPADGTTTAPLAGGGSTHPTVPGGAPLVNVQITAPSAASTSLPQEKPTDPIQVILQHKVTIFADAFCNGNRALLSDVFSDSGLRAKFDADIGKKDWRCPKPIIRELAVQSQFPGRFAVTIGSAQFAAGRFVVQWSGTEWLIGGG